MFDTLMIQPADFNDLRGNPRDVHLVGVGSLGMPLLHMLCAVEAPRVHIWDPEVVEDRNLRNQGYLPNDVGHAKVERAFMRVAERCPWSSTHVVLHPEAAGSHTRFTGIVMTPVDRMKARYSILEGVEASGDEVSLLIDGRVGLDGGKVFGFSPTNPEHLHRYTNAPHMHDDNSDVVGACQAEKPMLFLPNLVASHMMIRLSQWFHLEKGCENIFVNFLGFSFLPEFRMVTECWDE